MKKVFYIVIMMFFLVGCASSLYPEYALTKKYPQNVPNLDLQIVNDTTGVITQREDESIKQDFGFVKRKRHFLIITYIDDTNSLVSLKKGDTVVYYKKELYLINEKNKLIFNKKE